MRLLTVLLYSFFHPFVKAFDSEGTEFVFLFTRNQAQTSQNRTRIWVSLVNRNPSPLLATLTYPSVPANPTNQQAWTTQNVTIPGNDFRDIDLPPNLAWDYSNSGFQKSYDTRIFMASNGSLTVLGNNQDTISLQTDTFIVNPVSYATSLSPAHRYAVAAPKPQLSGNFTVFAFVPLVRDMRLTVEVNGNGTVFQQDISAARGSWQFYFGISENDANDAVIYATGDQPFAMIVASSCAPTTRLGVCDYAAFMPQPLTSDYFDSSPILHDHHLTDLWSSQSFYFSPPRSTVMPFTVESFVNKNNSNLIVAPIPVNPFSVNLKKFDSFEIGENADLESENCLIQVTRMGGLPYAERGGAFLDVVPAWSQALNESSAFITRYPNDVLICFLDITSSLFLTVDGTQYIQLPGIQFYYLTVDDLILYQFMYRLPTVGFHQIGFLQQRSGLYSCYVMGNASQDASYGYLTGFNRQQVWWLPNITTTTSTTTTTTAKPTTSMMTTSSGTTRTESTVVTNGTTRSSPSSTLLSTMTSPITTKTTTIIAQNGTSTTTTTTITTGIPVNTTISSNVTVNSNTTTTTTRLPTSTGKKNGDKAGSSISLNFLMLLTCSWISIQEISPYIA